MATLDRRHALGLAAVAAGGSLLAACGGDEAPAGTSATGTGKATGSATPGAALVATADVPVGGGVIVTEQQLVVTQPSEGEFKAFSSICTHQKCPVTGVADGSINCTCHGSKFSVEDGSVLDGPADSPLAEKQVTVSGDSVTLA